MLMLPTHTEGGDPGSLYEKKIKVKDLEGETGNTLSFDLTSQNMECLCVFWLVVVYACAQRGGFRIVGEGVGARPSLRGLEGDLSEF